MNLTPAQYRALRFFDPEDEYSGTARPNKRSCEKLELLNLLERDYEGDTPTSDFRLAPWGKQFIRDYVAQTGNGPEDLKAMFRF